MENDTSDLHIFFLPFLAPGHMIPMVDLAKLFATRNIKCTVITTTKNVPLIIPSISNTKIQLLTLPFPDSIPENIANFPTPDLNPGFIKALGELKNPFNQLISVHKPDCIISDIFYPWTTDLALEHAIPRIAFHGSCAFATLVMGFVAEMNPQEFNTNDEDGEFVVPKIPDRIRVRKCMVPRPASVEEGDAFVRIMHAQIRAYGMVFNSFAELEAGYVEMIEGRSWFLGPVSLCNSEVKETAARGGEVSRPTMEIMDWLDDKKPGSVLFVCFGSLTRFTKLQLDEIATGLDKSDHPFVWVVKNEVELSKGFERNIGREGKGLIIRGWAPQWAILTHSAIGGFMTHCGWNSCMEGVTAGVPMVTWPQFGEQFINERLFVDVLGVGVSVGAKICSPDEEKRTFVKGEEVTKTVNEMMVNDAMRRRAKETAKKAMRAVGEGGSSFVDLTNLIQELVDVKRTAGNRSNNDNDNI